MTGTVDRKRASREAGRKRFALAMRGLYEFLSLPAVTYFLLGGPRLRQWYGLGWWGRLRLVYRMYRNTKKTETGTSFRAHVAMASKILAVPPKTDGVIVECGCWKGGTTANLSLIAAVARRRLIVYDSFEGLPEPATGDRWAHGFGTGAYKGELEEVRGHVTRYGAVECCEFRKGWFSDTLAHHTEPVVAAFVDVDYQDSLHDCILNLWPHLTERGWLFIDEYSRLDYCALFFSEWWWQEYFDRPPPGLMGTGSGIGVGHYFTGPLRERTVYQAPNSVGMTRKDFYGMWDFVPEGSGLAPRPYSGDGWTTTARLPDEIAPAQLERVLEQQGAGNDG